MRDADKAPRGGADKHQRIEDRQMADEVVAELGVGRMRIVLIDEGDPGWPPQRLVHIALARIGGDVARGATQLADRNETLRDPNAAEAELARQDQRSLQAQEGAQRVVAVEAQVDEPAIGAAAEVAVDGRKAPVEERRPGVNLLDRPQMPGLPTVRLELGVTDRLRQASRGHDWRRQPLRPAARAEDAIAVAPSALVELDVVVEYERVGEGHRVEIAEPGQVARLHDGDIDMPLGGAGRHGESVRRRNDGGERGLLGPAGGYDLFDQPLRLEALAAKAAHHEFADQRQGKQIGARCQQKQVEEDDETAEFVSV